MMYTLLADVLTLVRVGVGIAVVLAGWLYGAAAFPYVVGLVAVGWISDGLDGPLARLSKKPTRLGRYDFLVDVFLTWATFAYLILAGYIPWILGVLYTAIALVVVAYFQRKSVVIVFMRPIDLTSGIIALRHAPEITLLFIVWLVGLAVVRWRRFKTRVQAWLQDLWTLVRRKGEG